MNDVAGGAHRRSRPSPWLGRLIALLVVAAIAALLVVNARAKPLVVEVVTAERGTVSDEISSSKAGEVMAEQKATVRAEVAGRVLAVKHRRGERVKKGDVIVALDPADLDARLKQAEATLATQRAQLVQTDAHAEAASASAGREKRLADSGAEPGRMADDAAAQAREAQAAAKVVRGQIDQSDAAVQVARGWRARAPR